MNDFKILIFMQCCQLFLYEIYLCKCLRTYMYCVQKLSKCRNHLHHLGSNVSKYIHEIPAVCEGCSLHSAENETQCDTSQLSLSR